MDGIYGCGGMAPKIRFDFPRDMLVFQLRFFGNAYLISTPLVHAGSLHPDESFVEHANCKHK